MAAAPDRRRGADRRQQQERRVQLAAIQADYDDLRKSLLLNIAAVKRLEAEQQTQLVRIAQIQQELDALKKARE